MSTRLSRDEAEQRDRELLEAGDLDVLFAQYWDTILAWIHTTASVSAGAARVWITSGFRTRLATATKRRKASACTSRGE